MEVDDHLRDAFHYENLKMRQEEGNPTNPVKAFRDYFYAASQVHKHTEQKIPKGIFTRRNRWQRSPTHHYKPHKAHKILPEIVASIHNLMGGELNSFLQVGLKVNEKSGNDTFIIPLFLIRQDPNETHVDWDAISDVDFGGHKRNTHNDRNRARNLDGNRHLDNSTSVGHGLITKVNLGEGKYLEYFCIFSEKFAYILDVIHLKTHKHKLLDKQERGKILIIKVLLEGS